MVINMKKLSLLFLFIISILSLSGCWDKREIEDATFAVLLGVDKAENNNVVITVAFPLTQTQGGGLNEGMDNGSGNYSVMSVKAPTMVEGLHMLGTKLSGPLSLYTVKTIVISKKIAENDMLRQIFSSWRYEEIRNTASVLISDCTAAEFIEARITKSPIDPLRQEELLLEQANDSAYYKPIQLLELLANLDSGSGDGVTMYGGIAAKNKDNSKQNDEEKKNAAAIQEAVKTGYLPGEIPISSENESQISGLAVFRGAKMVGVLDSMEAQAYSMLTQGKAKKILTIPDPLDSNFDIVIAILPGGRNKITSTISNGIPVFHMEVKLKCSIESVQSPIDYTSAQNYNILTEHIRDICAENMGNLIAKTQKEYNADILKLGNKLAYHFHTVSDWEKYNWRDQYKDAEINLRVRLEIERSGIMLP